MRLTNVNGFVVSEMFHLRKFRSADRKMWFDAFLVLVWTLVKMSLPSFWLWLNLCVLEIHLCIRFKMLSTQKIKIFYGKTTILIGYHMEQSTVIVQLWTNIWTSLSEGLSAKKVCLINIWDRHACSTSIKVIWKSTSWLTTC